MSTAPHPLSPLPTPDRDTPLRPAPLRYAYGTNGLADLRLPDALRLLADLGYDGVGLTLDHMHLDPLAPDLPARTAETARLLAAHDLTVTVETGARYVLDPRRKHHPTLLDPDPDARARRLGLLRVAVRVAAELGAHALHFASGPRHPDTPGDEAWALLADAVAALLPQAETAGVPLAVEPEPGHLLGDLAGFHRLRRALDGPQALGLTLDLGHCHCLEPESPAACVRAAAPWLRHVQIEDMRRGVHEHLPFGEGEMDFPPVLRELRRIRYRGLVTVELPRHSHAGPELARDSRNFLREAERRARRSARPTPRDPSGPPGGGGGSTSPVTPVAPSTASPGTAPGTGSVTEPGCAGEGEGPGRAAPAENGGRRAP
ncbi:sugar phosphate isomerase/epimerase [Streptomyces sp. AJS327]|uniref:sugar phosphate isomerase/epimerase family protein n=1 Tax=Streptomyces sp. AJS327 TaxID=2545265 RepID=UPI0015E04D6D|nr:sugar phosphate isomerase/epimerase family protein [Streptomyces sp. AJS327]MBA0052226.1 sugar phosphate isomerase/epimerase [Streptomyces sp. AJS327]